jgi:L-fucose isomerase-like protein
MNKLSKMYPEINFVTYDIRTASDVEKFLKEEGESYLLIVLNSIAGLIRPILYSHKPTVIIAETYGGAGEYLMEYSRALEAGMPIVGIVTRDITSENVLKKIELLEVICKLRRSKILFIVSPSEKFLMELEYPLSTDLYSSIKSLQAITGITPIILSIQEFIDKYYKKVEESEAKAIAEKWINNAKKNVEKNTEEIIKSAKLYIAMKKAAFDYKVDAIALDCIVLHNTNLLDAWPCLGYMELWNDNIVPVCEADAYSGAVLLIMKYLADRPGFISDPSPDDLTNEVVYYHCMAPLIPYGSKGCRCPYTITPAHLGAKSASVHVELPTNETITAVGFSPEERTLVVHTAQAVKNEFSP